PSWSSFAFASSAGWIARYIGYGRVTSAVRGNGAGSDVNDLTDSRDRAASETSNAWSAATSSSAVWNRSSGRERTALSRTLSRSAPISGRRWRGGTGSL